MNPLISIIIPTYNRAHLIGETLDSVLAQTFRDWECIIVDDKSKDATQELMEFHTARDSRFKFFIRPKIKIKGANSCRNYGFEKSTGKYIQWFDSDDIMRADCLKIKLNKITEGNWDFVVAKLENFLPDGTSNQPVYNRSENIIFEDYLFRRTNWITHDALTSRRTIEKYHLRFNEYMSSDQEYNYYCKLLSRTTNGVYIDEILVKRRIHPSSIQNTIDRTSFTYTQELFKNRYLTFLDIQPFLSEKTKQDYLDQIMTIYYSGIGKRIVLKPRKLFHLIIKNKGIPKLTYYMFSLVSNYYLGKGFWLLQKAKGK
mgnify:CR=1 FL=1